MATRRTNSKSSGPRSNSKNASSAIALLTADHDKVKKLFREFSRMHQREQSEGAEQLAREICNELTIHAAVEEEIFYPEVREAINDDDLVDEAEVEHASAKDLIAQIESMNSADEKYAAKVMVLGEYINHHIKEEQNEMFPKAKKAKVDMNALGEKISMRKQQLKAEMGIDDEQGAEAGMQPARPRARFGRTAHAERG